MSPVLTRLGLCTVLALTTGLALAGKPSRTARKADPMPYHGAFVSDCRELAGGLRYMDRIELSPSGQTVNVQYRKLFFDGPSCENANLLATFHLPVSRWNIDATFKIDGKTAHRVSTYTPDGQVSVTPARPDAITETPEAFVLKFGAHKVPVEKATEGGRTKELRMVDGRRLYLSDQTKTSNDVYPTHLEMDNYYERP